MLLKKFQFVTSVLPDDKSVINIAHPESRLVTGKAESFLFESLHKEVTGDKGEPMAAPSFCSQNLPPWWK